MSRNAELGAAGERTALEWLRAHKFVVMDTNWRMGHYELDIVASRGDRIHFIEVKLRRTGSMESPEAAMTPHKCRSLLKAANLYIELHAITYDCQIDLVAIDYSPDGTFSLRYIPQAVNIKW